MKTINDAAQEYAINKYEGCTGIIEDTLVDFKAGVEFAQRWIPVEEELPEVGDVVLVRTKIGKVLTCEMYIPMDDLGNVLGEKEWCGSYNFKQAVTHWRPVNLK